MPINYNFHPGQKVKLTQPHPASPNVWATGKLLTLKEKQYTVITGEEIWTVHESNRYRFRPGMFVLAERIKSGFSKFITRNSL